MGHGAFSEVARVLVVAEYFDIDEPVKVLLFWFSCANRSTQVGPTAGAVARGQVHSVSGAGRRVVWSADRHAEQNARSAPLRNVALGKCVPDQPADV
jgi:hypothetical protein